jgi:hypothetical protein
MDTSREQDTPQRGTSSGAAAAAPAVIPEVQTPALGGSYLVDPESGALTLVERTKNPNEE